MYCVIRRKNGEYLGYPVRSQVDNKVLFAAPWVTSRRLARRMTKGLAVYEFMNMPELKKEDGLDIIEVSWFGLRRRVYDSWRKLCQPS